MVEACCKTGTNKSNFYEHNDYFKTRSGIEADEVVELMDMTGRVIRSIASTRTGQVQLNTEGLKSGVYLLRLSGSNQVQQLVIE